MYWIDGEYVKYKTENMTQDISQPLFIAEEADIKETTITYEIKKFNLETEQYEHTNEKAEFEIGNEIVPVIDGFVIVELPPKLPSSNLSQPTEAELIQAEILLSQQAIVAKQKEQDDVLALLLLNQQKG